MFRARIMQDYDLANNVRDALERAPRAMEPRLAAVVNEIKDGVQRDLLDFEPPEPHFAYGEFPWTNDDQRIAVMAKYRERAKASGSKTITRYRRTHELVRGWRLRRYVSRRGHFLVLTQEWDGAAFVIGDPARPRWQQRFHQLIGWPTAEEFADTLAFWGEAAEELVYDAWEDVVLSELYGGAA